jgi:hypothetical protein
VGSRIFSLFLFDAAGIADEKTHIWRKVSYGNRNMIVMTFVEQSGKWFRR